MPDSQGNAAVSAPPESAGEAASAPDKGPDPLIGQTINGRFRVVSVIARGGMGKVYKAEQAPLGRICALKVLNPKYDGDRDPEFHKRFFLEAATAAKLTHPNTVTIFDYGQTDEIYYIAMEFIEGRTLHRALREEGPLQEARVAHIAAQICRSLREAHGLGVVHRDLKPGNILLTDHGDEADNVKVLDFGLVKDVSGEAEDLTQQGLFMGSPKYMAPEQILGTEVSARTDIYSLGVMMYEMICGKVPFDRGASVGTLMAHVNEAPPAMRTVNPGVALTPSMESIITRCLDKDPAKRFPSMKELLGALKRVGGEGDIMTDTSESLPMTRPDGSLSSPPLSGPMSQSGTQQRSLVGGANPPVFASPSVTDSLAQPTQLDLSPPARKSPKWAFIGVGALLVVAAGGAFTFLSREPEGPLPTTQASASAAPLPAAAAASAHAATPGAASAAAQPAAAPTVRTVRIESEPAGASVSENGTELCSSTPCEILLKGDGVGSEHKLKISKKGYKNVYPTFAAADEKVTSKLDLIPVYFAPPPPPPKPKDPNYKPSPY